MYSSEADIELADFAPHLIEWQRTHGRHDLPWQRSRDPYRIWLSEIMLQQTRVSTVIPYYLRFLKRFPNIHELASASIDDVMALWSGLGYYARARNLYQCAQRIVQQYGGAFPKTIEQLVLLPGIGRSTAAAISAFAFGVCSPILDGNVKRVLARMFGIDGFPGGKQVETAMWNLAESLLPTASKKPHNICSCDSALVEPIVAYTQGLMDLGATLCVRSNPNCDCCPFMHVCVAHLTGRQCELPVARPKKAMPTRQTVLLILRSANWVLLEKRASSGIWGGLWSLPNAPDVDKLAARAAQLSGTPVALTPLAPLTHTFTHFRLEIEIRLAQLSDELRATVSNVYADTTAWVQLDAIGEYGLPAPVRKILDMLS
ncbi:A/G-specific adenine glycosylase [Candidatus Vallotia cooleyia]|uniref:A/G-specific adenine glycosylase n=1 Tax=Candidatus Vallotiella adelgis TaxID=1177211 RepID=UPI001D0148EB|nr:A/G-specific adenine glycosylase [Candidatus Vallotia cooleyia]